MHDGNDGRVFTSLSDCLVTVANDLTDVQRECLLAGIDAFTYSDAHNGDPYHYCLATDLGWGVCI